MFKITQTMTLIMVIIMLSLISCKDNKNEVYISTPTFNDDFDMLYIYCKEKSDLEIGITQKACNYYYKNLVSIKSKDYKQEQIIDEVLYLIEPYDLFKELGCSLLSANQNQSHIRHMLKKYIDGIIKYKIYTKYRNGKKYSYKSFLQFGDNYNNQLENMSLSKESNEFFYMEYEKIYYKYVNDDVNGYDHFINIDSISLFNIDMGILLRKLKK